MNTHLVRLSAFACDLIMDVEATLLSSDPLGGVPEVDGSLCLYG